MEDHPKELIRKSRTSLPPLRIIEERWSEANPEDSTESTQSGSYTETNLQGPVNNSRIQASKVSFTLPDSNESESIITDEELPRKGFSPRVSFFPEQVL